MLDVSSHASASICQHLVRQTHIGVGSVRVHRFLSGFDKISPSNSRFSTSLRQNLKRLVLQTLLFLCRQKVGDVLRGVFDVYRDDVH